MARQFKYLGVVLEGSRCIKSTITHRLECMARAQACSYRALKRLSIHRDPLLVADMFDIVARAAGEYGCEVWATPWLDNWHLHDCPLQRSHISILKRCLGVKASTSSLAALFECGKYPMQVAWLVRCCKFWNKLLKSSNNLVRDAIVANTHYGLAGAGHLWCTELCKGLSFACPDTNWREHLAGQHPIDTNTILAAAEAKFRTAMADYSGDPCAPECEHRKHCCYKRWMFAPPCNEVLSPPAYLRAACSYSQKRSVARFRLSNAPIRVNTEPNTPFCERTCRRCMAADVDNEAHTLLHCTYLADVRESYQYLFLDCNDIAEFMQAGYNPDTAPDFVKCIHKIMTKLEIAPASSSASHRLTAGQM